MEPAEHTPVAWARPYSFLLPAGVHRAGVLKIVRRSSGLRWELRRVLPGLGYGEERNSKCCITVRDQLSAWDGELRLLGERPRDHRGPSHGSDVTRAADAAFGDPPADSEQEFWISSFGLVARWPFWRRRRKGDKKLIVEYFSPSSPR